MSSFKDVLLEVWRENKRSLVAGAAIMFSGLAATQYYAHQSVEDSPAVSLQRKEQARRPRVAVDSRFLSRLHKLVNIIIPSWHSRETLQLIILTLLLLARTALSIHLADVVGYNAKVLVDRKFADFVRGVLRLGAVAIPASIVNSGLKYFTNTLSICFRRRLSQHVHEKYLNNMVFYKVTNLSGRIDNADQRITEDVAKFCDTLSELYGTTFKPIVDLVMFSSKLFKVVGWKGPSLMFLYYAVSSLVLRGLMPSFARLTSHQQHLEGNFRFAHSRLITNAEEIAFLGGGDREKKIINSCYEATYNHSKFIFRKQAGVNVIDGMLVKYGATMAGYAVCALPVFTAKQLASKLGVAEDALVSELTKNYVRDSRLLVNLATSIGQLIMLYKRITALAGYTARVSELIELLDRLRTSPSNRTVSADAPKDNEVPVPGEYILGDSIKFEHVDVVSPDNTVLLRDLTFDVKPGMNLLVTGPNGCGKSSMFRVLGELWPLACGRLTKPKPSDLFYIPQKPYLAIGTLRDQVTYPHDQAEMKRAGVTDADLLKLLDAVHLRHVYEREEKGFDAVQDWQEVLSGGEKQRVAMARLYYNKPKYAILDECTSAVSVDVEHELYTRCREMGITLITISHRKTLWKFHEYLLRFDDRANWEFKVITPDMLSE